MLFLKMKRYVSIALTTSTQTLLNPLSLSLYLTSLSNLFLQPSDLTSISPPPPIPPPSKSQSPIFFDSGASGCALQLALHQNNNYWPGAKVYMVCMCRGLLLHLNKLPCNKPSLDILESGQVLGNFPAPSHITPHTSPSTFYTKSSLHIVCLISLSQLPNSPIIASLAHYLTHSCRIAPIHSA